MVSVARPSLYHPSPRQSPREKNACPLTHCLLFATKGFHSAMPCAAKELFPSNPPLHILSERWQAAPNGRPKTLPQTHILPRFRHFIDLGLAFTGPLSDLFFKILQIEHRFPQPLSYQGGSFPTLIFPIGLA